MRQERGTAPIRVLLLPGLLGGHCWVKCWARAGGKMVNTSPGSEGPAQDLPSMRFAHVTLTLVQGPSLLIKEQETGYVTCPWSCS